MIKVSDKAAVFAAFLSSDRFVVPDVQQRFDDKGCKVLTKAILDYQPYIHRKLRTDDVEAMIQLYQLSDASCNFRPLLSSLAEEFLEWQGNCFVVKPERLNDWLALLSLVDGSWVIAMAYANLHLSFGFSSHELSHCIESFQCPFSLPRQATKAFADNHVHLGGHGYLGPSMLNFCLYGAKINSESFKWPIRPEYTVFESGFMEKADIAAYCGYLGDELAYRAFSTKEQKSCFELLPIGAFEYKTLDALTCQKLTSEAQRFISKANCEVIPSAKRWLLYLTGLLVEPSIDAKSMLRLVRFSNILRNYMVVSGVGLTQFVKTFGFKSRKQRGDYFTLPDGVINESLAADIDSGIYREFRSSPDTLISEEESYHLNVDSFSKSLKQLYFKALAENAHFVLHFTRSGDRFDKLQESTRQVLRQKVELLQDFSHSISFSEHELKTLPQLKHATSFDLRKAIRGYDVAGNENELPVEVFAPALRVLRDGKFPAAGLKFNRLPKPFITLHAGEDFSHLLSGLRAIDEAVVFCDYRSGDRIGHALALGVCPVIWAHRQQTAYLTVGDHLDNLVWCHQKALSVIQSVPDMVGVLPLLQEKIHFWSEYLYLEAQPPKRLYDAWLLRRNCPIILQSDSHKPLKLPIVGQNDPRLSGWVIDFSDDSSGPNREKHIELWEKYIFAGQEPDFNARRDKVLSIDCTGQSSSETFGFKHGRYFDSVSAAELNLYQAIQDWQMEHYAKKGVVLEACPTSNIFIGRFEHYHEHPIFRWDPVNKAWLEPGDKYNLFGLRKGAIPTCINTDDAALMPTTIDNEHRVLKQAASSYFDVGETVAEDWIERIRQRGLETFRKNHLDWSN
ncbi:antiviral RADAR system adenosine deaminase RdrB [Pseudoalteromonas sp. NC201]|uniref:antiviral RADAR system adenosine deaminase RdrB n=1 Tax=Pseudoalteromonas sp. NC201 TaxID=1514074 RepID=UPI000C7B2C8A|nr:antiviral RADAR system adenosine deaminase RdrB [Pseudoalteromonas sp. NC201]AUJ69181.1 adenosine deaminase [Pseudoalteromonas sp. NC201]